MNATHDPHPTTTVKRHRFLTAATLVVAGAIVASTLGASAAPAAPASHRTEARLARTHIRAHAGVPPQASDQSVSSGAVDGGSIPAATGDDPVSVAGNPSETGGVVDDGTPTDVVDLARSKTTGYALAGDTAVVGRFRAMSITLVSSTGVENYRSLLTTLAAQLTSKSGIKVTVAAGTTTDGSEQSGIIRFKIANSHWGDTVCGGGSWDGCAGPVTTKLRNGRYLIQGGRITIRPSVAAGYSADMKKDLLAHELGHVFGLAHYNGRYANQYQVMKDPLAANRTHGYGAGDLAGIAAMSTYKVRNKYDLDCDGKADSLSRDAAGNLLLTRGSTGATIYAAAWEDWFSQVIPVSDLSGDSVPDLIGVGWAGALYLYNGSCDGTFATAPSRIVGSGWQNFTAILASRDFNGDAKPDLIARTADGIMLRYSWTGTAFSGGVEIGHGWAQFPSLALYGDYSGDGLDDVIATRTDGSRVAYLGNGTGGFTGATLAVA